MVVGTFWGVVLVPGLYVVCKAISARLSRGADEQTGGTGASPTLKPLLRRQRTRARLH